MQKENVNVTWVEPCQVRIEAEWTEEYVWEITSVCQDSCVVYQLCFSLW